MIRLKNLLKELSESDIQRCLDKIQNKQFRLIGAGDNGRVYEIDGEDKTFKITQEQDEYKVANIIVNRYTEFTTFIPVYYVDGKNMYIMANAEKLTDEDIMMIDKFMDQFGQYARNKGGEVTIFEFLDNDGARYTNQKLVNFLRALQRDINKTNIPEFDLDLDFNSGNIMIWNGNMVMVDW